MTKIYFVRHGESMGNVRQVFQGASRATDYPLTETGLAQAKELALRFADIQLDHLYCSPLRRAVQTAQAINWKRLPLIFDARLEEVRLGEMEGKKIEDFKKLFPEEFDHWVNAPHLFKLPGGEHMRDLYDRMKEVIIEISLKHKGETVAVASHGCAIRNALCFCLGVPFDHLGEVPWGNNTAVSLVEMDGERPQVIYYNDISHIVSARSTVPKPGWWIEKKIEKGEKKIE